MSAAVKYLETDEVNTAYTSNNLHTGQIISYNFADVEKQLEGKISFKSLLHETREFFKNPKTGEYGNDGKVSGYISLEVVASQLTASPPQ